MSATDANGRTYIAHPGGSTEIDDSAASSPLPLLRLPRLRGPPSCGLSHCVAVTAALEAISWATHKRDGGKFGQLGHGAGATAAESYEVRRVAMPAEAAPIAVAAAGDQHSAFVDADGAVWACGLDRWTQLGQPALWSKGAVWHKTPRKVAALDGTRIVDVDCGSDHTIALDEQRRVWAWGRGEHGQLFGPENRPFTAQPTVSRALSGDGAAAIVARGDCSCAASAAAGALRCVGRCDERRMQLALAQKRSRPLVAH